MNNENILNDLLTIIDENGEVFSFENRLGRRHIECLEAYANKYDDNNDEYGDYIYYKILSKNNNLTFLNLGKEIKNDEFYYHYIMLVPEFLTEDQQNYINNFIELKNNKNISLNIYRYNKEKDAMEDTHYKQKLQYDISVLDELANEPVKTNKTI